MSAGSSQPKKDESSASTGSTKRRMVRSITVLVALSRLVILGALLHFLPLLKRVRGLSFSGRQLRCRAPDRGGIVCSCVPRVPQDEWHGSRHQGRGSRENEFEQEAPGEPRVGDLHHEEAAASQHRATVRYHRKWGLWRSPQSEALACSSRCPEHGAAHLPDSGALRRRRPLQVYSEARRDARGCGEEAHHSPRFVPKPFACVLRRADVACVVLCLRLQWRACGSCASTI